MVDNSGKSVWHVNKVVNSGKKICSLYHDINVLVPKVVYVYQQRITRLEQIACQKWYTLHLSNLYK